MLKLLLFTAILLQCAAGSEYNWAKKVPADLLTELGIPPYEKAVEEDFELVKDSLIIRFDREWSSSDPSKREACEPYQRGIFPIPASQQVCLCYYSRGANLDEDSGCGPNYAIICSLALYEADMIKIYVNRRLLVEGFDLPIRHRFTVEEKIDDNGNRVPMIRMKKLDGGCGLIYLENVKKQKKLHEKREGSWQKKGAEL